ncbi:TonB family protein [Paraburkholderia acidisoli]|uniref:TonB family protein n=2 Tax=Paraburkholderia acidisoli TaxID=2571748 RepID=A0A7Z2JIH0_9BURK|nr:TonB family protein [Paraburkholderia acidisoli]
MVTLLDARRPRAVAGCVLAVALWSAFVGGFVGELAVAPQAAPPVTLDARLVEIVPPPAPSLPRPLTPSPPTAAPRAAAHVPAPARSMPVTHLAAPHAAASIPAPLAKPAATPVPSPAPETAPAAAPQATTAARSATDAPAAATDANASGNAAAHALVQPLPVIPDDLRDQGYQALALARFTIHADGSVDVALVHPTQNPRLNQILLESLRKWRFFPAMKAGHPVESEQDIRVHFNVE